MKLTTRLFAGFLFLCALFMQGIVSTASAAQTNKLNAVRAWPSPDNTRVVLDLANQPDYQTHYLKHPDRLVIDLKSTTTAVDLKKIKHSGPLVNNLRESASGQKKTYRLVVDLNKSSQAKIFVLPPAKPYGHRLVIDLPHNELSTARITAPQHQQSQGRDIIIAIDAGHGGDDPGAVGKYSYEKNITLQIARRLHRRVNQQTGMSAFLVRNGDYFVDLNKRSAIARKGKADFLVSIHADGFTSTRPRGASVLVLSMRRATTEQGRWMENHEARSELIGGAGVFMQDSNNLPYLQKMVLDMSMGNAMDVGFKVGEQVVSELKQVTTLHQAKPVHASLAVLKSPDIPSILVEAGFITNRTEERLLNQAEHQNKIAQAVFQGIYKHFTLSPPQDTLFAQKKRSIKHTVRSGESLSALAERYSVSLSSLNQYNNLQSASVQVGQVLNIPPNYQVVETPEPPRQNVRREQPVRIHKVTRGQSLSVIAAQYDTTVESLKTFNNLSSSSLAIGQNIKIPGDSVDLPVVNANFRAESVHTVSRGESLSLIAGQYDTTIDSLKTFNNLRTTSLRVGQKIKIPASGQQVAAPETVQIVQQTVQAERVHNVARGESLSVIAEQYGTTSGILKVFNELRSTSLRIGQKIKIPAGGSVAAEQKPVPTQVAQQTIQPERVHNVVRGEALSVIAEQYGTTTDTLKTFNGLRSTALLVGQKIKIPASDAETVPQVAENTLQPERIHKVTRGQSLSVIAEQYGTTSETLKSFNNLSSTSLAIGQNIKIPASDSVAVAQVIPPRPSTHTVQNGESLSVVAERYGVSFDNLKTYNKLDSNLLLIGQVIQIPPENYAAEQEKPQKELVHKVKSGESLSVIAQRYSTSSKALKAYNELNSTTLWVGQKIKIPAQNYKITEHKVRSGESLSVIADRYGTTSKVLKEFNKLSSTSLKIGQVLTIPVS